jgi:hypothetical protein
VFILKGVKVLYFDTLLQVFILKVLAREAAKSSRPAGVAVLGVILREESRRRLNSPGADSYEGDDTRIRYLMSMVISGTMVISAPISKQDGDVGW